MQAKDLKFGDLIKIKKCIFLENFISYNNNANNSFYVIVVENKLTNLSQSYIKVLYKEREFVRYYINKQNYIENIPFEKMNL